MPSLIKVAIAPRGPGSAAPDHRCPPGGEASWSMTRCCRCSGYPVITEFDPSLLRTPEHQVAFDLLLSGLLQEPGCESCCARAGGAGRSAVVVGTYDGRRWRRPGQGSQVDRPGTREVEFSLPPPGCVGRHWRSSRCWGAGGCGRTCPGSRRSRASVRGRADGRWSRCMNRLCRSPVWVVSASKQRDWQRLSVPRICDRHQAATHTGCERGREYTPPQAGRTGWPGGRSMVSPLPGTASTNGLYNAELRAATKPGAVHA